MATLYEIDTAILDCIDTETGEIIDESRLSALNIERDAKIEGVALWYKNSMSDAEAYKKEKDHFSKKQRAAENRAESLKQWLAQALAWDRFKTSRVSISYRKSESVEIDDIFQLSDDYLKYSEPTVDKVKIKEAMKHGTVLNGVRLVEKKNIQIK